MEKEKQLKEFDFHGLRLIGVYGHKTDSWWFRGKEVYRCLGVSAPLFTYYIKQIKEEHKKKLSCTKVNKIFDFKKSLKSKKSDNHYETLISEAGLYRLATCLGKTKECEEFKDFVFEDLLVSLRKAEQEMLEEENKTLEEWIDTQEEWIDEQEEKNKTLEEKIDTLKERIEYLEAQNAGLRADLNYWKYRMKQIRHYSKDDRKNPKARENQDDWTYMYDNY